MLTFSPVAKGFIVAFLILQFFCLPCLAEVAVPVVVSTQESFGQKVVVPRAASDQNKNLITIKYSSDTYKTPSWKSEKVGQVEVGRSFEACQIFNGWYKIFVNDYVWVNESAILDKNDPKNTTLPMQGSQLSGKKGNEFDSTITSRGVVYRKGSMLFGASNYGFGVKMEVFIPPVNTNHYAHLYYEGFYPEGGLSGISYIYYPDGNRKDVFSWFTGVGLNSINLANTLISFHVGGRKEFVVIENISLYLEFVSLIANNNKVFLITKGMIEFDVAYVVANLFKFLLSGNPGTYM